jgi:PAS domain S-box-containing protein
LASSKKKSAIHVLHVDDDPSILEISRQILMDMGSFDIDNACCVDEAFKKLAIAKYDVVVSDYEMPQKSGLEFLKELREQNNQIPFILFTGKGREEVVIKALNLGANCYVNKQGTPETVYAELASSVTQAVEHAKTQSLLRRSEERFSFLSAATFEGIGFSEEGKIVDANNQLEKMLGYSHSKLLGRKVIDLIAPESRDFIQDNIKFGTEDPYECLLVKKDGSVLLVEIRAKNMCYKGQLGRVCAIRDISERKKSETSLKEAKDQLELQFKKMPVGCIVWDKDFKAISWNPASEKIFGYSAKEAIGKHPYGTIVSKEAQPVIEKIWRRLLEGGETANSVNDNLTKDGKLITCSWSNTPLKRDDNSVIGVLSMVQDITESKRAEQAIIESEKNYRSLINGMSDAVWVVDFNGNFVEVNDAAVEMLGYSKEELLSMGVKGIDKHLSPEQIRNFASSRIWVFETVHTTKDGKEIPVEISSNLITYNGKQAVLSVARNITERKRAEQDLKESEEKYRTLFEQAGDYTLILEAQSTGVPIIFDANISALQIHGYTREEIIGKPITFLDEESGNEQVMDRLDKLLNNEKLTFEAKHRRKDDSTIDVEVSIKKVKVGLKNFLVSVERDITERKKNEDALRQERGMLESVTKNIGAGLVMISKDYKILWMNDYLKQLTGASENKHCYSSFNTCTSICPDCGAKKVFEGASIDRREYCNQTEFNKDHPVWFELIATPIKDKDGNVVAALELTVLCGEKKEGEKKQKENSDRIEMMDEKLRVVGSLTRHDVGNKLMAAKSNVYLLKKRIGDNPELAKYFDGIDCAFVASDKLFEFSRVYERIGVEKPSKENVFECFNQAAALVQDLGSVKVVNECQGLVVVADSLLRQLFYNFIDNSLKHGEKVTQIRLHYTKDGNGLKLFYEDDGVGVPNANKSKLFEVGFTTGNGTGLGLYLVKKMMEVYGWTITEDGEYGKGAKFVISIPSSSISSS